MENQMTTMKGRVADQFKPGEITGLDIERALNGFMVRVMRKAAPAKCNPYPYREPDRQVFTSVDALCDFVRAQFGGGKKGKRESETEDEG